MLKEKYKDKIDAIIARYPEKRAALLPLLWLAQEEQGYLSEEAMREIAGLLSLTPPQVYETVTFYTMYRCRPIGKFHIQVCRSLSCALVGKDDLLGWIQAKLGIQPGQTTPGRLFTLSEVECLASCATGPMMQINDDYYEQLTQDKVNRILEDLKRDGKCVLATGPFMVPEPKMGSDSIFPKQRQ
jgi:NADH-quinone oxidoreductase E subunit